MNPDEKQTLEASANIEDQYDEVLEKLESLELDDETAIRRKRADALRREMKQKQEWIADGHGVYTTLASEKEFFDMASKKKCIVLHLFHTGGKRCAIVDKHLDLLAKKHIETKFCKLDVMNAPFLCQRMNIHFFPTIVLCRDSVNFECIIGFDSLGGVDDFPTEMMEWRLAKSGVILYDGDLSSPPEPESGANPKSFFIKRINKNIRGGDEGMDSD